MYVNLKKRLECMDHAIAGGERSQKEEGYVAQGSPIPATAGVSRSPMGNPVNAFKACDCTNRSNTFESYSLLEPNTLATTDSNGRG
jgi:hypothetical protein